jgi:intracellular multiplication protein IcmB
MSYVLKLLMPFQVALRKSVESFIRLETADDERTLVAEDGSLLTFLRIDGSRQIIGEEEYKHIVEAATMKIGARFDRAGHAMQVYFARDPNRIEAQLERMMRPSRQTARAQELELDDLFDERIKHLSRYLIYEECYFVLWTRPSILTKSELQRSANESKQKKWVSAGYAQNPLAALDPLRNRHKSFISALTGSLHEMGLKCEVMEVHDALRSVKDSLYPTRANEDWRACLPGDPIPPRAPQSASDMSDVVWPALRQQLATGDAKQISNTVVQIGEQLWAGADMTLGPMDASPFPMLLNRLFEAGMPYRISFLIEGGGSASMALRTFAATILGVTNALNKQVKYSLEGLEALSRREPVVKIRVSFATWAPKGQVDLVEDRLSTLIQSVESWGYCQVSEFSGDPLDCVLSSALGIHCASTAPSGVAPMYEIMKLLPWQRPSSPFDFGAMLFRTPDGKHGRTRPERI